jgi:hypothetical protein
MCLFDLIYRVSRSSSFANRAQTLCLCSASLPSLIFHTSDKNNDHYNLRLVTLWSNIWQVIERCSLSQQFWQIISGIHWFIQLESCSSKWTFFSHRKKTLILALIKSLVRSTGIRNRELAPSEHGKFNWKRRILYIHSSKCQLNKKG